MKILLTTFCATYSHTPLALYALKAYLESRGRDVSIEYFTVNQPDGPALEAIYKHRPDVLGFSCYCWNIEKTLRIASSVRKLLPEVYIVFGGPETEGGGAEYIASGIADEVICGEGERELDELIDAYPRRLARYGRKDLISLDCLPFPYSDLNELENKIIYYEASRGCPFTCGYCLSCGDGPVRFKSLETVYKELNIFLDAKVVRVKFTDRTFNANKKFAESIWEFLIAGDNGVTCFHFEIAADILDADLLSVLSRARRGLFQFEIGVQTLNKKALAAISRPTDIDKLFSNVRALKSFGNIHLHLDLIAGLPFEGRGSFAETFNGAYALEAEQLQLGFLKVLKGTPVHRDADRLGLVYSDHPPYEILATPDLTYDELTEIKRAEEMLELFYNSGKFVHTVRYILRSFESPFEFFGRLADFWSAGGYAGKPHGKLMLYEALREFCKADEYVADFLRLDLLLNENERNVPEWMSPALTEEQKKTAKGLKASNRDAVRVEFFNSDLLSYLRGESREPLRKACVLIFVYPKPGRQDSFAVRDLSNVRVTESSRG